MRNLYKILLSSPKVLINTGINRAGIDSRIWHSYIVNQRETKMEASADNTEYGEAM